MKKEKFGYLIIFFTLFSSICYAGVNGDEIILEKEQLFMPEGLHQGSPFKDKLPSVIFDEGSKGTPVVGCAPLALSRVMFSDMGINPNNKQVEFQYFLKNMHKVASNSNYLSFYEKKGTWTGKFKEIANDMGYVIIHPKRPNMDLWERKRISDIYIYVRDRIKEKTPVIVASYTGGHAFVIDGYATTNPYFGKEDLYFHILYGWKSKDGMWVQIDQGSGLELFEEPTDEVDGNFDEWNLNDVEFFTLKQKSTYRWNGNGSIISYSTGTKTGYGLNYDVSKIHPNQNAEVFFQWELDSSDGENLKITAPNLPSNSIFATITYGGWGSRSNDRVYKNVSLPFILDPRKDGWKSNDGDWKVVKVAFDKVVKSSTRIRAEATNELASDEVSLSLADRTKVFPTNTWNGNASIISKSSDNLTGFGINYDVTMIHPDSLYNPTVFFQWEVDSNDGKRLEISATGMPTATITYGGWNTRSNDIKHENVNLPYYIDPEADGINIEDGSWLVIKVDFNKKPLISIRVDAEAVD